MGAHTLGPIPVLTRNASTSFLARAQLSLKCPRTSALMFQICCPDGVIALSISADWFLMWSGIFLIFPFCAHQTRIFLCPWLLLAAWFHLCINSALPVLWVHDSILLTAASQGLAILWLYLLSYTLNLASDFPALDSSQLYIFSVSGTQFQEEITIKGAGRIQVGKTVKASKIHFVSISFTKQVHLVRLQIPFKKLINPW